jgi:hypothetical protein
VGESGSRRVGLPLAAGAGEMAKLVWRCRVGSDLVSETEITRIERVKWTPEKGPGGLIGSECRSVVVDGAGDDEDETEDRGGAHNEVRPHSALDGRTPNSIILPPCSLGSRPLRVASGDGLRPALIQAGRDD